MTIFESLLPGVARSVTALRKAAAIVDEYVLDLYGPLHGLSRLQRARRYPLLLLVEYLVYRVDAVAERARHVDLDLPDTPDLAALTRHKARFVALLRRLDLYDAATARELDRGEEYVRLENKLTTGRALDQALDHALDHALDLDRVRRAAELRPTDVRLLHCLLLAQLGRSAGAPGSDHAALLALLWPIEVIADLGNDLQHYAADVARGDYNTYAMFVRLYGDRAPAQIADELARYRAMFHERLAAYPATPARKAELARLCTRLSDKRTSVIPAPLPAPPPAPPAATSAGAAAAGAAGTARPRGRP